MKRETKKLIQMIETLCKLLDERLELEMLSNPIQRQLLQSREIRDLPIPKPGAIEEKTMFIKRLLEDIQELAKQQEIENIFGGKLV